MEKAINVALLADLVINLIEKFIPVTHATLPIGGDHFSQLSFIIMSAIIMTEWGRINNLRG